VDFSMRTHRRKTGRRSRRHSRAPRTKWSRGLRAGYAEGFPHGYHMGRYQRILKDHPPDRTILWELKVLFVPASGSPYTSINEAVANSLYGLVREVIVASAEKNIVQLAGSWRPDLVLVLEAIGQPFPLEQVDALRTMGVKTAVWLPDDPYHTDQTVDIAPHYDYVFTLELSCVELYRSLGCPQVHYLPLAVDPQAIAPSEVSANYRRDICFIGTPFSNRVALFDEIAEYLQDKDFLINGFWWDRLTKYELLKKKIQGYWLSPDDTAKHYHAAKIVINMHRSIDDISHNRNSRRIPALSVNPRMFEIAACGTLQLTDVRQELSQFYTPGVELDTFSSPQELIEKLEYYLKHEEQRQEMALRGLVRTLKEHTYRHRLHSLLTITNGSDVQLHET
jgi:spore maturation protein CgeB